MKNPERAAQAFVDGLALIMERENLLSGDTPRIHRFTPSIKIGRRYLAVECAGLEYMIQVDVRAQEADADLRDLRLSLDKHVRENDDEQLGAALALDEAYSC